MASAIVEQAHHPIIDLVGQTGPKELLAVLARAGMAIAPDTGPLHIAAAAGTPVIGLYATSNPARTGPRLWQEFTVDHYAPALAAECGRTPQRARWGRRVRAPHAMQRISTAEVVERVDALADRASPASC